MEKMSMIYDALLEMHAEKVLDEAIFRFKVKKLYQEIDDALQQGDQNSFLMLTNQLKSLNLLRLSKKSNDWITNDSSI